MLKKAIASTFWKPYNSINKCQGKIKEAIPVVFDGT